MSIYYARHAQDHRIIPLTSDEDNNIILDAVPFDMPFVVGSHNGKVAIYEGNATVLGHDVIDNRLNQRGMRINDVDLFKSVSGTLYNATTIGSTPMGRSPGQQLVAWALHQHERVLNDDTVLELAFQAKWELALVAERVDPETDDNRSIIRAFARACSWLPLKSEFSPDDSSVDSWMPLTVFAKVATAVGDCEDLTLTFLQCWSLFADLVTRQSVYNRIARALQEWVPGMLLAELANGGAHACGVVVHVSSFHGRSHFPPLVVELTSYYPIDYVKPLPRTNYMGLPSSGHKRRDAVFASEHYRGAYMAVFDPLVFDDAWGEFIIHGAPRVVEWASSNIDRLQPTQHVVEETEKRVASTELFNRSADSFVLVPLDFDIITPTNLHGESGSVDWIGRSQPSDQVMQIGDSMQAIVQIDRRNATSGHADMEFKSDKGFDPLVTNHFEIDSSHDIHNATRYISTDYSWPSLRQSPFVPRLVDGEWRGYAMTSIPLGSSLGPLFGVIMSKDTAYDLPNGYHSWSDEHSRVFQFSVYSIDQTIGYGMTCYIRVLATSSSNSDGRANCRARRVTRVINGRRVHIPEMVTIRDIHSGEELICQIYPRKSTE